MKEEALNHFLLYDNNTLTDSTNTFLLNFVIDYKTSRKRFGYSLAL